MVSDETLKTLASFDTVVFSAIVPWGLGLFVLGASVVILRSEVLAKWIGWLGLAVAVLAPLGTLWIFAGDNESFFGIFGLLAFPPGFLLWSLSIGIILARSKSPTAT